jgi:hypothetical protein
MERGQLREARRALSNEGESACRGHLSDRVWPSSSKSTARRSPPPSQDEAVELLLARGYSACEIEFGHMERGGPKRRMAIGMLDHSAGIAAACGGHPNRRRLDS